MFNNKHHKHTPNPLVGSGVCEKTNSSAKLKLGDLVLLGMPFLFCCLFCHRGCGVASAFAFAFGTDIVFAFAAGIGFAVLSGSAAAFALVVGLATGDLATGTPQWFPW